MKRSVSIFLLLVSFVSLICLSGCASDKVTVTREQYKTFAEQCGLKYKEDESTLDNLTDGKFATAWLGYFERSGELDSFFYVFNTDEDAKKFANSRLNRYLEEENSKNMSAANYIAAEYSHDMSDYTERNYFCQVENTVFIISYPTTDEELKALGEKFIKALCY